MFYVKVIILYRFYKKYEDIRFLCLHLTKTIFKEVPIYSQKVMKMKNSMFSVGVKRYNLLIYIVIENKFCMNEMKVYV